MDGIQGHPETVLVTIGSNCTKGIFKRVPVPDVPVDKKDKINASIRSPGQRPGVGAPKSKIHAPTKDRDTVTMM
jgi:hypothetical protein